MGINDVAVSSGSACTSQASSRRTCSRRLAPATIWRTRQSALGLGRWTSEEEVDYVVDKLTKVVRRLREMSPLYEMVKEGVDLSKMHWVTH
jgi:cysteine desulfurase